MQTSKTTGTVVFFVNGQKIEDSNIDPEWTVLYYLRNKLRLCGTKLGCAEGGCGACTVMVSKYDWKNNSISHLAVNACLAPVCAMHGLAVTTVEGIGSVASKLHPVQERIAKSHGSQCGFCTPGIVMSMYALLRSASGKPTMEDIEIAMQGNLCRCTGYRPILDGFRSFTQQNNGTRNELCSMGSKCCKNTIVNGLSNGTTSSSSTLDTEFNDVNNLFNENTFKPYDSSQEIIFPPELAISDTLNKQFLEVCGPRVTCFRPIYLHELISLKNDYPNAKIVNGNTEVGIEVKFKQAFYQHIIIANMVHELSTVHFTEHGLQIGAATTLSDLEDFLGWETSSRPYFQCKIFKAMDEILKVFAGKQIRNVAAIGGNIMTGSPISDIVPILMAANAQLQLKNKARERKEVMDHKFWTGYRQNIVQEDEVLCSILLPFTSENTYFKAYKQSRRRDDDIAIVTSCFFVMLEGDVIKAIRLAFGGMGPTAVLAKQTADKMIGKVWNKHVFEETSWSLLKEFKLDPAAPGGMVQYRFSLVLSSFFKFYLYVCDEMEKLGHEKRIEDSHRSGKEQFHYLAPSSSQYFTISSTNQEKCDTVGRPVVHQSAFKHATGEAVYCDDMPAIENELFISFVLSSRAHAKIKSIDPSEALKLVGVVNFVSAKDIPKDRNHFGPIVHDEEVLASEKVICQGQVIGGVVAIDQLTAQRASKLVKIEYEDIMPVIITTQEAIQENSFFPDSPFILNRGNTEEGFSLADHIIEGDLTVGGQDHFYLETHSCIVIPKKEDNEIEIYSSTQHPTEVQHLVAEVLGIPSNRVVCKVKRLGGGFGGKESRSCCIALPVAVAAFKTKRPVRVMLDRNEDMMISGQRHPFYGKYRVGFKNNGSITACKISLYCNAGCSKDLSDAVMERAMFHVSNTSLYENITLHGYVCKTNLPSNTAFRGFGAPQAMLLGETIIHHIAESLGADINLVHSVNFYKEGQVTHFKQKIMSCSIQRCWEECIQMSNYSDRKCRTVKFNREHRFRKRGISLIPTMFGIGFSSPFLNQAGALVLVYTDGSVLITHGGTEMGQGLHTKMIQTEEASSVHLGPGDDQLTQICLFVSQLPPKLTLLLGNLQSELVASRALGISPNEIHISETSTSHVPNTSATAGSASSDLNGMAIIDACNKINERLEPIKKANPKGNWKTWIKDAYFQRIQLSASGFFKTQDIGCDDSVENGNTFNYFTYGVACSEVEIDCLSGDHQVLRTDIVMDLGESLNPAIDIGQVEGAFMQGYGLFTLEELVHSPTGVLYSRGPGAYKIPGFPDIPAEFNVALLKGSSNPRAVYSSKAVGEPPLFLASSVFFAIREAVKDARRDHNVNGWFPFNSPATCERIRLACVDQITDMLSGIPEKSSWNVVI